MNVLFLNRAIALAQKAEQAGEVPVGAVVVFKNEIIGEGYNQPIQHNDPTLHAEIVAIRAAAKHLQNYRLVDCDLYVTLEPCPMCLGAMLYARIKNVYFGAYDAKLGACETVFQLQQAPQINHRLHCHGGLMQHECQKMLRDFFKSRR